MTGTREILPALYFCKIRFRSCPNSSSASNQPTKTEYGELTNMRHLYRVGVERQESTGVSRGFKVMTG